MPDEINSLAGDPIGVRQSRLVIVWPSGPTIDQSKRKTRSQLAVVPIFTKPDDRDYQRTY